MRIYEIAKELGVSSKDVMSLLKTLGVDFSNHMSVLPENVISKVKQRFSENKQTEEKAKKEFEKKEVITSAEKRSDTKIESKKQVFKEEPKVKNIVHQTREIAKEEINILPEVEKKPAYVPKKSDYIAEPLQLAEEELIDEVIEKNKISKLLTNKIGLERRTFRPGRRRKRRKKQVTVTPDVKIVKEIVVDKSLPLFEVASLLGKQSGELIMALMRKGMVCNRNHILSTDIIKSLADHFGVAILAPQKTDADKMAKLRTDTGTSVHRWPVVVVMGHVDHGKTTLLDYIRKMNVAGSEKGGITQHLGAYEVDSSHGKIVFIDTPGHEAFSQMRERGAKITDIAILVVAVDDGIMPQTVEAINHAKAAGVPIIVAINKIDKNSSPAALETIKRQLAKYELMPEDWGGNVVVVPISAKTGQGVNELLEMIVLQSQLMDLKADISVPARAFILESKVQKGLGPVATVICTQGTLKQGDFFTCGASTGRVRVLINSQGKRITQVLPSIPAQVVGFDSFAAVADWLTVVPQDVYSKARQEKQEISQSAELNQQQGVTMGDSASHVKGETQKVLNLIIKSDTRGSIDAVLGCIQKLSKLSKEINCPIRVMLTGIGDISEGDVELAEHSHAIIYAFHVKPEKNAGLMAKEKNVDVRPFDIVYHLVEDIEKTLESKRKIETVWKQCGEATVKKVFDIKGVGIIAGCYMRDGVLSKGNRVTCMRDGRSIGVGKVVSLQRDKKSIKEVHAGYECGFVCEGFNDWQEGDTVICSAEVKDTQKK